MSDMNVSGANFAELLRIRPFRRTTNNVQHNRPSIGYSRLNSSPSSPSIVISTAPSPFPFRSNNKNNNSNNNDNSARRSSMPAVHGSSRLLSTSPLALLHRAPMAAENVVWHQVEPSDTIQGLALKYGVTVEEIKRRNRLWTSKDLAARRTLEIPQGPSMASSTESIEEDPASGEPPESLDKIESATYDDGTTVATALLIDLGEEISIIEEPKVPLEELEKTAEKQVFEVSEFKSAASAIISAGVCARRAETPGKNQAAAGSGNIIKDEIKNKRQFLVDRHVESPRAFLRRTDNQIQVARQRLASFSKPSGLAGK